MKKIITNKKTLMEFLTSESKKYGLKSTKYPLIAFNEKQILYQLNYLLRKLEYYTNTNKKIRRVVVNRWYQRKQRKYLMNIPINVFDIGLCFIHLGPRIVNSNATIGKNFIMHIMTSIVAGGTNDETPNIGDNVIMSVNSVILGKSNVGNNVVIAAGAVVNKNFSEGNMTIGGIPAGIISNNDSSAWTKERRKNYETNQKNY